MDSRNSSTIKKANSTQLILSQNELSSSDKIKIFTSEYELLSLLPINELPPELISHGQAKEKALTDLYLSLKRKIPSLNQEDIAARVKNQCNEILELAIKNNNEALRDIAIYAGAAVEDRLLSNLISLSSLKILNKEAEIKFDSHYLTLHFLLNSKIDLPSKLNEDQRESIFLMALNTGPEMAVLLLNNMFRQGYKFNHNELVSFFENKTEFLKQYIFDHTIDLFLEKDYLRPSMMKLCAAVLELESKYAEFFAAMGDEPALKEEIKKLNIKNREEDKQTAYHALQAACYFSRENTARVLITAAGPYLTPAELGDLLFEMIKEKNTAMCKLLLPLKNMDIQFNPAKCEQSLYGLALQSDSLEVQQLFVTFKVEKQIQYLRQQAHTWFSFIGADNKASRLEQALKTANERPFHSVQGFLNSAPEGSQSITQILAESRILGGKTASTKALEEEKNAPKRYSYN